MNRIYLIFLLLFSQNLLKAQTDTIPPVIACPPHDTVTLGLGGVCTYQYFYAVTSSDNEPGDTLAQVSGLESGSDFPLGNTVNVFVATDAAGNTASCSFQLTVQQYFGALICQSFVSASIGPDCMWQPEASLLLDGNFGCPAAYLVELDETAPYGNGPWEPASFGPDDVGKTYIFRVTDTISGNNCIGNIKANDMLPPTLTCQDFTISCAVDNVSPYFLKDSLGIAAAVPLAEDACGAVMLNQIESTVDSSCTSGFVGVISRTWTAQDVFGNTSTCIQQIHLTRPQLSDLRFPPNVTVNCANADISSAKTGKPYLEFAGRKFTTTCSLGSAFNDSTVQICPGSSQVLRTWFAIDWCTGENLDTVQVINVQDDTGPAFLNCPPNVTISASTVNCLADVDLPDLIIADACSYASDVTAIWEINNVADTLNGILTDFPGNDTTSTDTLASFGVVPDFPPGIHSVRYLATDGCGSTSLCEFNLHVWDSVPPAPTCPEFMAISLTVGGTASISATTFDTGSSDDCGTLYFKVNRLDASLCEPDTVFDDVASFCCHEVGDTVGVVLRVYDVFVPPGPVSPNFAISQSADCLIYVLVQDPDSVCGPPDEPIYVAGEIKTETSNPVFNAKVKLEVNPASQGAVFQTQTDDNGIFSFSAPLFADDDYVITPFKNNNHLDGVSTYDLVLITKHILGLEYLNSPYKIIAADANHSGLITTFDVVELRKLILGIYDSLPNNTSWRFVDKNFSFPNPANPFQSPFPETISDSIQLLEYDFVGIKVGDVNNTTLGDSLLAAADDRTREVLFFNVKNRDVRAGEEFTVQFTAAEKVLGWQFTLNTNGLEVVEVLPGEGMGAGNFGIFRDAVTTSVESGTGEFSIKFRSRKAGQLSEMLSISSRITRAEAYKLNDFNDSNDFLDVALRFDGGVVSKTGFELYQNQPNPFRDKTSIGFYLPENADATLTVFDETGRVVFTKSGHYEHGYNAVSIDQSLLGDAGVLFYKLETAAGSAVRKMVLIK